MSLPAAGKDGAPFAFLKLPSLAPNAEGEYLADNGVDVEANHTASKTREAAYMAKAELAEHVRLCTFQLQEGDYASIDFRFEEFRRKKFLDFDMWKEEWENFLASTFFHAFMTQIGVLPRFARHLEESPGDEEVYLGAIVQFCRALQRYAVSVATHFPANCGPSVEKCSAMVQALQGELMQFDFRNGPLRRKYDQMKYMVKELEDLQYLLSFVDEKATTTTELEETAETQADAPTATAAGESQSPLTEGNREDFKLLQGYIEKYDLVRDEVIKKSRDITKAGKQSIYASLRGDLKDATKQIDKGHKVVTDMLANEIAAIPSMRSQPSFSMGIEELQEAFMVRSWLKKRKLERYEHARDDEYLGGVADFTGELQRWAVQEATKRRKKSIDEVLRCQTEISVFFHAAASREVIEEGGCYPERTAESGESPL